MATRKGILRNKTYKEDGLDVGRRVYYTLLDGEKNNIQVQLNSEAIALLIETLHKKRILTETNIDDILFKIVH